MNQIKNIFLLSLSVLYFTTACSTTNDIREEKATTEDIRVEKGITAEQRKIALALAKEFGIEKIQSIHTPFDMTMSRSLAVRGDEQLESDIGRYKELDIYLEEESFDFDPPRKITPTLYDCSMSIVEFVELEIENGKKRVLTKNINPEFALKLLTKIYNSDFTLAPDVDAKDHPSKELMRKPDRIERRYASKIVVYEFELMSDHVIIFTVEEGNIVVQEYEWHIH